MQAIITPDVIIRATDTGCNGRTWVWRADIAYYPVQGKYGREGMTDRSIDRIE